MKHAFVVVDDFYDDPDGVRERALQQVFRRPEGVNYPGVAAEPVDEIASTMAELSRLLGGIGIKCRRNEGEFRVTTAADMAARPSMVHIDSSDFSALVHLSKEPCEGTYFYRHKRLGLDRVGGEDLESEDVREAIKRDTLNPNAWEVVHSIPMKYNRLVVFDGKYFHSGPRELKGADLVEGRLTQNFFFFRR